MALIDLCSKCVIVMVERNCRVARTEKPEKATASILLSDVDVILITVSNTQLLSYPIELPKLLEMSNTSENSFLPGWLDLSGSSKMTQCSYITWWCPPIPRDASAFGLRTDPGGFSFGVTGLPFKSDMNVYI